MIAKHEANTQKNLKALEDKFKETPEQKLMREAKMKVIMDKIKAKKAREEYDNITDNDGFKKGKGFSVAQEI